MKLCKTDPKHGPAVKRGLCRNCYQRWWHKRNKGNKKKEWGLCSTWGCGRITNYETGPYCYLCKAQLKNETMRIPYNSQPKKGNWVVVLSTYPIPKYRFMLGEVLRKKGTMALVELKPEPDAFYKQKITLHIPCRHLGVVYKKSRRQKR